MPVRPNAFLTALGVLLFGASVCWGECAHCYRVANVELVAMDGTTKTGYMTVFNAMIDTVELDRIEPGTDLLAVLDFSVPDIGFVDSLFHFDRIGPVVAEEHVSWVDAESLSAITLHKLEYIWGTSEFASLPESTIALLQNNEIRHVADVQGKGQIRKFANINPVIDEQQFETLLKHAVKRGARDHPCVSAFYLVANPTMYEQFKGEPPTAEGMTELLKECEMITQQDLAEVSELQLPDLPEPNEMLAEATTSYEERLAACRTVLDYLARGDVSPWDALKDRLGGHPFFQKVGFPSIETAAEPGDTLRNAQIMCRTLVPLFRTLPDSAKLERTLDSLEIIRIEYAYD